MPEETTRTAAPRRTRHPDAALAAAARRMWASGSYARIAELVAPMGRDLVCLAGIAPGNRVLDVAAGTGNAAIPAARAGARVTATDLTPELLEIGRSTASRAGVELTWREADAEELPFPDASFDVALSCIGAIFAPDHRRTASELTRVCRPGGLIAMANWTPDGYGGRFFGLLARYSAPSTEPSATGSAPPSAWGRPEYVRDLFGDEVTDLRCSLRTVRLDFTGPPEELADLYRTSFGPVIATRDALRDDPDRCAALDRELVDLLRAENTGTDTTGAYAFEYLAVSGHRSPTGSG